MKISIITINYNDKVGLQKTFDSVFNQTNKNFEYLVIDGNSNDGSKELIEENVSKINFWISEKDTGVYNAMNKGIKAAKGEYLIFMNSGDSFYNHEVIEKTNQLIDGNSDIYYGNALFISENEKKEVVYNKKIDFNFFRKNNFCHQATFIKKQLFETSFYYSENLKIVSDWEFFIFQVCKNNAKIKHLNLLIANYDLTGMSSVDQNKKLILEERNLVYQKYFSAFIDDYDALDDYHSRRNEKFRHIKKHKWAWTIFKSFSNLLLIFLPKEK